MASSEEHLGDRNDFVGLFQLEMVFHHSQLFLNRLQDDSSFSTLVASLQRAGQPRLAVELFDARCGEKVKTSASDETMHRK